MNTYIQNADIDQLFHHLPEMTYFQTMSELHAYEPPLCGGDVLLKLYKYRSIYHGLATTSVDEKQGLLSVPGGEASVLLPFPRKPKNGSLGTYPIFFHPP